MASGGFISADVAWKKLLAVVASGDVAKQALIEALGAAYISARGRPLIFDAPKPPSRSADGRMSLRDITAPGEPLRRGEVQDIPTKFWTRLSQKDGRSWDWDEGYFLNSTCEPFYQYTEVVFNERETNRLIKKHKTLLDPASDAPTKDKKERRRNPSWDDWVAAVVILSQENQITQGMTVTALLDRVNARLQTWDCEPKEQSTVTPTASAILKRFASNPPVPPIDAKGTEGPKP